jgi:ABC-type transporter Mla MlaB component
MLRITIAETATEQRWTLEGRLVQPWVGELRTCWKQRHRAQNGRGCTVDLSEVTFIDNSGLRLLRTMSKEGTHFIATGIYTKHVLEHLKAGIRRGLVIWFLCLFAASLPSVIACPRSMPAHPELGETNTRQEFRARLNPNNGSNTGSSDSTDGPRHAVPTLVRKFDKRAPAAPRVRIPIEDSIEKQKDTVDAAGCSA